MRSFQGSGLFLALLISSVYAAEPHISVLQPQCHLYFIESYSNLSKGCQTR